MQTKSPKYLEIRNFIKGLIKKYFFKVLSFSVIECFRESVIVKIKKTLKTVYRKIFIKLFN